MFKKEKLKVAKVDLDNDLEIPEFDFDAPPPKDDRKPVKKIFDGLISGAKSTLFSKDLLKSTVRKAMPDGFGEAVDMAGTVSGEAKKIYSNAVNQIKPSINEMARTAGKLAPAEKVKTKAALDSVAKWAKNNAEKYSGDDVVSQREAGLNLSLNEVFKFQAEQTIKATAEQNIKDKVQTGLEIIRHKDNFGLLNNISLNTSRLSQYQEKITAAFQKKSLEIQYRSYFVAIDALEESKRQNALVKLSLENITKNTALPEIVKTTQHESFKINARNKFWNSVNDGLFGGRNNLIGKISENIGKSVREKIASATEAFSMATMVMDGVVQQREMAESFGERKKGLAESAAGMAGGMGVDYLASKAGTWVKGKLDKNKKLSAMSRKAGNFVSNAPQHLNEFKRGNKGETDNPDDNVLTKVGNFFIRAFKSVIPNMDVDASVESDKAESLTAPFSYTKQTHKSINEVIPGFLSRIFRELQVLRTGNTKIGLSTYDFTKNKFTSLKEANDNIIKSVMGVTNKSAEELIKDINNNKSLSKDTKNKLLKEIETDKKNGKFKNSSKTYTQNQIDNIFDLIDPTGTKLDTKARDALGKKLLDDNLNTRLGSASRLADKATFQEDSTKQYAELFATVFKDYFKDDDKEIEFNKSYSSIGSSMNDSRGFIQNLINLGQYDLLKSTGLINADGSKIDIKKLQSLSLGDGSDFKDEILNSNSEKSGKGINKLISVNKSGFNRLAELLEEILDKSGTALSDYRTKKNIKPVSGKRALNALRKTPVSRWNYKNGKGDGKRHIGPMAQTVNQTMGDDAAPDGTSIDLITMNGITMSAVQELDKQQNNPSKSDSLIEAIINTNKLTLDKLEEIKQTILNTGGVGDRYDSGSLLGSLKGLGKAGLNAGKNIISGGNKLSKGLIGTIPFKGMKNIFEIAGNGIKSSLQYGVDKINNLRKFADVFIEGEVEPRITEMKLRAGKYFMEDENGKRQILTDISKIKGKIVDETGKIIISTEELGNMFTKNVKGSGFLKLVTGLGSKIIKTGNTYSKFMLGLIPPALRSASNFANTFKNKVFDMLDEPIDIYIPGNPLPIMLARIMKHGGYISQRTQKIILRPGDIDGPVLYEGKIVLSVEDIQKGLLDSNGNPIKLPLQKIKDFALKNIKTVIDFNKKIFKQAVGFAKTGISKIKGLFGKNKSNNESESKLFGEQLNIFYLRQIRDILDSRLPSSNNKKFNDTDGDGLREGSWKTMGKKVKDKAIGIKDGLKNTIAENLGGGAKPGIVSKMINKLFGIKDKDEVAEDSLDELKDIKNILMAQAAGSVLPGMDGTGKGKIGRAVGKLGGAKNLLRYGGKALGAAGAAYGAYSVYDNIQKGNYGQAAIDGAMAVGSGALAYGGLGALGSVAGAAGGAALTGVGALASGAAAAGGIALTGAGAVGGALLTSPVLLGAAAIAGVGAIGYFGYKFYNSGKISKLTKLRLVQYGFFPEQKDAIKLVMALEDKLYKNVSFSDGVASLNDKNFNLKETLALFGIDPSDEKQYNNWVSWFTGRFKPVFLTHLTALKIVNNKLKLSEIDDLVPEDKLKYLNLVKFSEGPYQISDSPIGSIKELSATSKDVTQAFELAKEEIEKESKTNSNKTLMGAVKNDVKNILNPDRVQETQSNQTNVGDDIKKNGGVLSFLKDKFTNSISTPLLAVGSAVGKFFGFNATILETIRFKTYGIKTLERNKVSSLRTLEEAVLKNVTFSSNGTAEWSSTAEVIIRYVGKNFGVESPSSDSAKNWINWFVKRFLPVYLAYLGLLKQATGKEKQEAAESSLKPSQEFEIATKISAINGVWAITTSPWSDYALITDINEVKDNLALLREKSQKDELVEAKKSSNAISEQNKVKQSTVKNAIETKGMTDGETKPNEPSSNSSSTSTSSVPKTAGGALSQGLYASQFVKLGPGVTLDGLHPEMRKNFNGMVEEYGNQTGKSLYVTSGSRTYQQQEALYKKNPNKAAPPGRSLHEFGLAFDASSSQLDELDKLGLMRKYGFTRPVGGETWHVEPSGIQQNITDAKNDDFFATNAIKASVGRGGGGIGSIKGSKLASRDPQMAKQIFGDGSSSTVQTTDTSKPTVQSGGAVIAGSKTEENKSEERKSIASNGKGYINSANKNTIASVSGEDSKANDFKSAVPGSGSGINGVPNAKSGSGLSSVRDTIEGAAKVTGVDPELMLGIAGMESSFNPNAKAKTSSASGLYQFVDKTWDEMISRHGKKYGLDANSSPMDAKANALMGGEFLKANIKTIANSKPNPNNTDLYLAHFLGASGARKFFSANGDAIGADILPSAAKSNKDIFYNAGKPRTVSEIYSLMDNKVNTTLSGLGLNVKKSSGLGLKTNSGGGLGLKPSSISTQSSPSIPNTSTNISAPSLLDSNKTVAEPNKAQNKSFSKIITQQPNSLMGFNNDQTGQPPQDTRYDMNKALSTVGDTLKESLTVQTNMYSVLKDILKSVNPLTNAMKNDTSKSTEQPSSDSSNNLPQRSNNAPSVPRATKPVPVPMNRLSI